MQPLIRLRWVASQLQEQELQNLIQTMVSTYDAEQMLSIIFNNFVLKFQQTKQHDGGVINTINMISNILNSRKNNKSKLSNTTPSTNDMNISTKMSNETKHKIKIDSIPTELIGECSSFLEFRNYISFSKCNRKIYIGCNSPSALRRIPFDYHGLVVKESKQTRLDEREDDLNATENIQGINLQQMALNAQRRKWDEHMLILQSDQVALEEQEEQQNILQSQKNTQYAMQLNQREQEMLQREKRLLEREHSLYRREKEIIAKEHQTKLLIRSVD